MPATIYLDDLKPGPQPGKVSGLDGLYSSQFRGTSDWQNSGSLADVEADADARHGIAQRHRQELADIDAVEDPYDRARKAEIQSFQYQQQMPADQNELAKFAPGLRGVDSMTNDELGKLQIGQYQADQQGQRARELERIRQEDDLYKIRQNEDYQRRKLENDRLIAARRSGDTRYSANTRSYGQNGITPDKVPQQAQAQPTQQSTQDPGDVAGDTFGGSPTPQASAPTRPAHVPARILYNKQMVPFEQLPPEVQQKISSLPADVIQKHSTVR